MAEATARHGSFDCSNINAQLAVPWKLFSFDDITTHATAEGVPIAARNSVPGLSLSVIATGLSPLRMRCMTFFGKEPRQSSECSCPFADAAISAPSGAISAIPLAGASMEARCSKRCGIPASCVISTAAVSVVSMKTSTRPTGAKMCPHFTFYNFVLCFAATATGALYHYLPAREAPVVGSVGRARNARRHRAFCRTDRAIDGKMEARSCTGRSGPRGHGCGLHRDAVPDRLDRHRIVAARHRRDGPAISIAPRRGVHAVHLHATEFEHGIYCYVSLVLYAREQQMRLFAPYRTLFCRQRRL
jgi:hypothetical protein